MKPPIKYIGLDTETSEGRAILVCTPTASIEPKGPFTLWRWLLKQGSHFVCHNADYDIRAMLHYCPPHVWEQLVYKNYAAWRGWRISYIPGKKFTISDGKRRARIYDSFPFFQTSLEAASRKMFGEGKDPLPRSWITRLGEIQKTGGWQWAKVVKYCHRDAELCQRLYESLQASFESVGIPFVNPVSPGSLAGKFFGPRLKGINVPSDYMFEKVYFGGRIEAAQRGRITGPLNLWDITSAYPWAQSLLIDPRFLTAEWRKGEPPPDAKYGAVFVRMEHDAPERFGPFPVKRTDGSIYYPVGRFHVWTTLPEYLEARKYWKCSAVNGFYLCGDGPRVFDDIPDLFQKRLTEPEKAQAYKLLLNSSYGKLAQSVKRYQPASIVKPGTVEVNGEYYERSEKRGAITCFAFASHITGQVRAKILRQIIMPALRRDHAVYFIATDGVLTGPDFPLKAPLTKELGQWGREEYLEALIIGSGYYALRDVKGWKEKHRGFRTDVPLIKALEGKRRPVISVPILRVDSLTETILRGRNEMMNVLENTRRVLNVNFDSKRFWDRTFKSASDALTETHFSEAPYRLGEFSQPVTEAPVNDYTEETA